MKIADFKDDTGYALPFILIVIFIITTLLMSLLTLVFFYNFQDIKKVEKKKIDLACYSALQRLLSGDYNLDFESDYSVKNIKIHISAGMKGVFKEITITGMTQNDSSRVVYLLGEKPSYPFDHALILSRPNMNITVAGLTKIKGNILTTRNAFTRGTIFGIRNSNESYLNGNIDVDKSLSMKYFDESVLLNSIEKQSDFNAYTIHNDYIFNNRSVSLLDSVGELVINGDLIISDSVRIYYPGILKHISPSVFVHGSTIISNGTALDFPVEIHSDSAVLIGNDVSINNSIFTTRDSISIKKNCYFKNCQFFSLKNISIDDSKFDYSSVLAAYVNTSDQSNYKNKIELRASIFNGSILMLCRQTGLSADKSLISIDGESKVQGLVYSENDVNIAGHVYGSIYTYGFRLYKDPSEYINWIVNLKLNRDELSRWFLLPDGFGNTYNLSSFNNFKILSEKWIY